MQKNIIRSPTTKSLVFNHHKAKNVAQPKQYSNFNKAWQIQHIFNIKYIKILS